jgi:menaquinone-dependent protoporphyrinogen oxidase
MNEQHATRVLVAYASREGQTRKIAEHLGTRLREHGVCVDVVDVRTPPSADELASYAHVVLAASIHIGKHEREMRDFVRSNAMALARIATSFLSVSMSEASVEDPKRAPEQRARAAANVKQAIDRFLAETGLHPGRVMPVAGALKYLEYGWLVRFVMKRISKAEGGPTDTSRDYEMTDWASLDRFADEIASSLDATACSRAQVDVACAPRSGTIKG